MVYRPNFPHHVLVTSLPNLDWDLVVLGLSGGFPALDPHGGFHYWWTSSRRWWNHNQSWHGRNRSTPDLCEEKKSTRKWSFDLYRFVPFLTHRILLSVWRVQGQIWPWRILGSESQLRCMGNWCVWNDNPSFSGNSSSISKHTSLVNTQFGSFAHKSHFIFPISPWSLDFPQKPRSYLFSLAVDYPSLKLTVSQEWVSFLPLTLEGFRVSCLPFGDFKPSLSGAKSCSFRGKIPTFPVWSSHVKTPSI